jgi:hypothetical protein
MVTKMKKQAPVLKATTEGQGNCGPFINLESFNVYHLIDSTMCSPNVTVERDYEVFVLDDNYRTFPSFCVMILMPEDGATEATFRLLPFSPEVVNMLLIEPVLTLLG